MNRSDSDPGTLSEPLADAFKVYIEDAEATISPGGFLHWLRDNRPDLIARNSTEAIVGFALGYLELPTAVLSLVSATREKHD